MLKKIATDFHTFFVVVQHLPLEGSIYSVVLTAVCQFKTMLVLRRG